MKIRHLITFPLLALLAFFLFSFFQNNHRKSWDPDAGLIPSYTVGASVAASSNPAAVSNMVDDDAGTAWQSDAPLPEGFINRKDLNIFLGHATLFCKKNPPPDLKNITDGDLSTACKFQRPNGENRMVFEFGGNRALFSISLKGQVGAPLTLSYLTAGDEQWKTLGQYGKEENYSLKRFEIPSGAALAIALATDAGFEIFELAGLSGLPKESIIFDFGKPLPVGAIQTKHWAGEDAAVETQLFLSLDQQNWQEAARLDPNSVNTSLTPISPEITARYLKVEHTLKARDWNKVFLWEVKAYDASGPYGPRPAAVSGHTKIRELLGVNGYWSWGTDQYSDLLAPDGGPYRYQPVAGHARNYHDMTWDLKSPSDKIDFDKMAAGGGTSAKEWLNWDREYKAWHDAGLTIQSSLQFYNFKPGDWKNPAQEAKDYATAFVSHFGPKKGNGLVCTIEVGNEPWRYPADLYQQILLGMVTAAKAADPFVEVFPCALQAADPSTEKSDVFKNYIGARVSKEAAAWLDGINIHAYSYVSGKNGQRKAVHPEHPNSSFWEILSAIRWRDHNMPGKKIYLSEWGWDGPGGGEDCTHDECVSEEAAACYAVRAALIALRLGIDRATWFYYANEKRPSSLYTRSGLTSSIEQGFVKKKVFYALESLVKLVGDQHFLKTIREDETAWMYLLGNADGTPTHLIAWRPVDGDREDATEVTWKTGWKPRSAVWLDGSSGNGKSAPLPKKTGTGEWTVELSAKPLLVVLGE